MNLKVMRWVSGVRYSSVAAADTAGNAPSSRLTVDVSRQIPRGSGGLRLRRGVVYGAGLRLDLPTPTAAARHPLVVYLPGGGFVVAPRAMASAAAAALPIPDVAPVTTQTASFRPAC